MSRSTAPRIPSPFAPPSPILTASSSIVSWCGSSSRAGTPEEKVVIPQAALIADQQGVYVFVVEDGKAVIKRVKPGGESGTNVVIESGLSAGAQVIVEGLQGVRAGAAVRASPLPQALRQG